MEMILNSKKIAFQLRDVATDDEAKTRMKEVCGVGARVPLVANGDLFCGDFDAFEEANEYDELETFLKL